ncbi:MAG: hypothetical protein ACD_75C00760G0005 [uncultured bacterium]|nr:MAG: hypothetical protein ACD_75C00760G0005 [uncultured bacterium]
MLPAEKIEDSIIVNILELAENGAEPPAAFLQDFLGSFQLAGRYVTGFT